MEAPLPQGEELLCQNYRQTKLCNNAIVQYADCPRMEAEGV